MEVVGRAWACMEVVHGRAWRSLGSWACMEVLVGVRACMATYQVAGRAWRPIGRRRAWRPTPGTVDHPPEQLSGDPTISCKRINLLAVHPLILSKVGLKVFAVKARKWCDSVHRFLKQSVNAGNDEACYILGMIRFYCLKNRRSGESLMAKPAIKSHTPSICSLAVIQFNGSGDFECNVPAPDVHPVNVFLKEWSESGAGELAEGLRLCSHKGCGRPETRPHEFRRCSGCGTVNYCSRCCQALDWKLRHKVDCGPIGRWLQEGDGEMEVVVGAEELVCSQPSNAGTALKVRKDVAARKKKPAAALGFGSDIVASTALVDFYSKWVRIEDAKYVFCRMPRKNTISWNAVTAGYGNHGCGAEAVELFEQLLREKNET
ncbi:F-box protein [Hibiscus syriacus]|uniref:F-box protein n=1 Tax=Hibiscus syriacus TaxID=106335 RepID=A0A6A3AS62_HIBSY|nr:F-box protein [Hibiscus syriacus]